MTRDRENYSATGQLHQSPELSVCRASGLCLPVNHPLVPVGWMLGTFCVQCCDQVLSLVVLCGGQRTSKSKRHYSYWLYAKTVAMRPKNAAPSSWVVVRSNQAVGWMMAVEARTLDRDGLFPLGKI